MVSLARRISDILYALLYYTRPLSEVFFYYVYRILMGKTPDLPPIKDKVLLMSATQLAEKIRTRQVKCEDVVLAFSKRARLLQPYLNAICDDRYVDALEDARRVDRFLEKGEKTPEEIERATPLLGVPFSCKEAIGVGGLAQTAGLLVAKGRVADKDSDACSLYRAAGAIPLLVTNVPQLCMWWDSSNLLFGKTKNPYDHSRTVGGSTGGEGALLTTAGAAMGIGNDIGGSIRIPSSFNGIYGHKPTSGIRTSYTALVEMRKANVISNEGEFPNYEEDSKKVHNFVSTGPMCRYAEDLPLLVKVLSGDDQRLKLREKVDFRKVKVYYMESFPGTYLSATKEIRKAVRKAANHFEEKFGIKAIPFKNEELKYGMDLWLCKVLETNVAPFTQALADEKGRINVYWEVFKSIFKLSRHTFPCLFFAMIEKRDKDQDYHDGLKNYDIMEQRFSDIFKEDSIVLIPTHPEPPPYYHLTIPKFFNISYTGIFNILGFPSTNIPAGLVDGVPIGLQAVSGKFNDHLTIAAALELDQLFGGWKSPSAVEV